MSTPDPVTPPALKDTTPRGRHDPIHDPHYHGKEIAEPGDGPPAPDPDDGASKDPRDRGDNGNPAQSSGRVSMEEQNDAPQTGAPPSEP